MTISRIYEWVEFACDRNEASYLTSLISIEWNNRFITRLADGALFVNPLRGRIRIGTKYWERASDSQKRQTIIHEACHIVAFHQHGLDIKPHGHEWKHAMRKCGVDPEVTTDFDLAGISWFYVRDCPRDERCHVSRKKLGELRRGELLGCTICGMSVDAEAIEV